MSPETTASSDAPVTTDVAALSVSGLDHAQPLPDQALPVALPDGDASGASSSAGSPGVDTALSADAPPPCTPLSVARSSAAAGSSPAAAGEERRSDSSCWSSQLPSVAPGTRRGADEGEGEGAAENGDGGSGVGPDSARAGGDQGSSAPTFLECRPGSGGRPALSRDPPELDVSDPPGAPPCVPACQPLT